MRGEAVNGPVTSQLSCLLAAAPPRRLGKSVPNTKGNYTTSRLRPCYCASPHSIRCVIVSPAALISWPMSSPPRRSKLHREWSPDAPGRVLPTGDCVDLEELLPPVLGEGRQESKAPAWM
ncbi:uncharacterized protein [Physcomitrium patens]|uniref:uncharacterized protein n=1 Tax=Physcomitrium patens TaxID=3218 RepID=UPI003CCD69BE